MTSDIKAEIDAYLESTLDDNIRLTADLCAQPSVSATGEGVEACAELVGRTLLNRGYTVHRFPTANNHFVVGHLDGDSEQTLLFYNHYDVQPAEPLDLWETPPFRPSLRDGALYARGAADDKGEFAARLAAVEAVRHAHSGNLPCGVTFVLDGAEESASPDIVEFVQDNLSLLKSDGAIWEQGGCGPDGRPVNLIGARGCLAVELEVSALALDAHSGGAHLLPNAAWRLIWALASLKGGDERIVIPGFYDQVAPPTARDLELLADLPDTEAARKEQQGLDAFLCGLTGPEASKAVFNPTCNVGGLTAGYQGEGTKTVIPARASAKLDMRLVPDQDPEDILAKLRAHLDAQGFADVRVTSLGQMWPAKADPDHPFVALTSRTGEEVYGKPPAINPMMGGSSPIYAFARPLGGIPVVTAGVGNGRNRVHSPNEHVMLEDFLKGAKHIARILNGFADL